MKKLSYFLWATLVCFSLSFISCDNNDPVDDDGKGEGEGGGEEISPVDNSEILNFPFSELTPEVQKEELQKDANAFLAALGDLKDNACIKTLKALNSLLMMNEAEDKVIDERNPEYPPFRSAEDIINNQVYIKDLHIQFTWNAQTGEWDQNEADANNQLEVYFPVEKQAGKIIVTAVGSGVELDFEHYTDYNDYNDSSSYEDTKEVKSVEIPKQFTAKIYLDNKEVGSISAESDIVDGNTVPSLTTLQYTLGEYTMTTKASKATPNVVTSTLKKGDQVLIDATADLTANIDNVLNDENPGAMKGNMVIRIMDNIAIAGNIDVDKYNAAGDKARETYDKKYDEIYEKYGNEEITYEQFEKLLNEIGKVYEEAVAKASNDNVNLYIASLSEKAKFARMIEIAKEYTESYQYYTGDYEDWDESSQSWILVPGEWVTHTYSYWYATPTFEFGDKSQVEAEAYFSEGFELFLDNLKKFIKGF